MHRNHVAALVEQRVRGSGLFRLVRPPARHDGDGLHVRVDRFRAHLECVHVAEGIADRHPENEAELVALGHLSRRHAHRIHGPLRLAEENAEVALGVAIPGEFEGDVTVPLGDLARGVRVAEAGRKHQLGALLHESFQHAFRFPALRHVLRLQEPDPWQVLGDLRQGVVKRAVVSVVVDASHVDGTDDQPGLLGKGRPESQAAHEYECANGKSKMLFHGMSSFGRDGLHRSI